MENKAHAFIAGLFTIVLGAAVLVIAQKSGSASPVFPVLGVTVCVAVRMVGLRYGVNIPIAPSERSEDRPRGSAG